MSHFQLTEPARDDIAEIVNRIASDNMKVALRVYEAMERAFGLLAKWPGAGAICDPNDPEFAGLRFWPVKKYRNYLVVYRELADGVEILRVLHAARDMNRVLRRKR